MQRVASGNDEIGIRQRNRHRERN